MVWWLLCVGAVCAMLGYILAGMLASGTRSDLEAMVVEARAKLEAALAEAAAWRDRHDSLKAAFSTLCDRLKLGAVEVKDGGE